jgi:hypothetical protein
MDGARPDALNDAQLDRELEAALGVEPSPEFLARVRTRIAAEPEPPRWRIAVVPSGFSRILKHSVEPLWAVGIVGIVLAIVAPRLTQDHDAMSIQHASDVRLPEAEGADAKAGPDVFASTRAVRGTGRRATTVRSHSRPAEVEVIVSRDEQQALQTLLRVAYEGRMPALPEAAPDEGVDPPDISIAPVIIERLPQIARLEEEGEGRW